MSLWDDLRSEFDAWDASHKTATLWWRDDDAVTGTPALARLCDVARKHRAGLCIAAIPLHADQSLLSEWDWPAGSSIVQHGYAHKNHAPDGEKKSEFGSGRAVEAVISDIERGWSVISRSLNAIAAFIPPWNRISEATVRVLPTLGFLGVSTYGPRKHAEPVPGLRQTNTHVDPIDWHGNRRYIGDDAAIGQLINHLRNRRMGTVDADEPTGLLTHHLVHDEACWEFAERLAGVVAAHPGARWLNGDEVFAS